MRISGSHGRSRPTPGMLHNGSFSFFAAISAAAIAFAGCQGSTVPSEEAEAARSQNAASANDPAITGTVTVSTSAVEGSDDWVPRVASREWNYLVIHHTATDEGDVESIHRAHRERRDPAGIPWQGIGYHFLVGNGSGMEDGFVEPTFRWREQLAGAHAGVGTYNDLGIGICLVGNFEERPPTPRQLAALKRLVDHLRERYDIAPDHVLRHGDIRETACPGKLFPMEEIVPGAADTAAGDQRLSRSDR